MALVEMTPPPLTPAEVLAAVDLWLVNQAGKVARRYGLEFEDVLQECRVRTFLHAGSYDPDRGRPTTWASTVIRTVVNLLLDRRGRNVRTVEASQAEEAELAVSLIEAVNVRAPDLEVADAEHAAAVRGLLAALDDRTRRAVVLRFGLDGKGERTGEEVARAMGVCRSTAVGLVQAGLAALREPARRFAG